MRTDTCSLGFDSKYSINTHRLPGPGSLPFPRVGAWAGAAREIAGDDAKQTALAVFPHSC